MIANLPAGAEHDQNAPYNENETFECRVCGREISHDGICSSKSCLKADQL